MITAPNLPENEPFTDLTNPAVLEKLQQAFNTVSNECKDVPIVIGGQEYKTDNIHYQVSVISISFCAYFRRQNISLLQLLTSLFTENAD